jgi:SAM-dependent methyltransferase
MNREDRSLRAIGSSAIAADFDGLALLDEPGWGHNSHYYTFLLRHVPERCTDALDIGCGAGSFARLLALRSERVLAIDVSPGMIQVARLRSVSYPNVDYEVADAETWQYPPAAFDCVASIATLHHLPLADLLVKIRSALRPGGVLAILDLYQPDTRLDRLVELVAIPVSFCLRLAKRGRLRERRAVRAAWAAHGMHDRYLTLAEVRNVCQTVLPGARVRRHLLWRYSVIWVK